MVVQKAPKVDTSKLSPKELKDLNESLAKIGLTLAELEGKSKLNDPTYKEKVLAFRKEVEEQAKGRGIDFNHIFTVTRKPRSATVKED